MHPEVVSAEPGTCPKCGMKLIACGRRTRSPVGWITPTRTAHDTPDGLEWEDLMPEINRASDSCNMIWKLVDRDTGKANWEIDWAFTVGDQVKIRLVNDLDQDHPMHHPFHIHGAGRFLVLAATANRIPTSCGRTPSSSGPTRPSTSSSTSPTPVAGWRTATSPNTTRAE